MSSPQGRSPVLVGLRGPPRQVGSEVRDGGRGQLRQGDVVNEQLGPGILELEGDLSRGQSGVERNEHRTQHFRAEEGGHELGAVLPEQRDPVALPHTRSVQRGGDPRCLVVQLHVGEGVLAVDHGRLGTGTFQSAVQP